MERDGLISGASWERVVGSYFASVTAGALTVVAAVELSRITSFESATNFSLQHKAVDLLTMTGIEFVLIWVIGLATMAIPCALLSMIARAFAIRCWVFYAVAGIAVVMLVIWVNTAFIDVPNQYSSPDGDTPITVLQELLTAGRYFGLAGGVAGLTFWRLAGRYYW
ncbi:hypothetical protein [Paraburkholderia megapolitana]|uniref:hypothetical protein n=1 Tax=Paraburkholderia megapolitana TaxID=420953 RepID=UPI0038BD2938